VNLEAFVFRALNAKASMTARSPVLKTTPDRNKAMPASGEGSGVYFVEAKFRHRFSLSGISAKAILQQKLNGMPPACRIFSRTAMLEHRRKSRSRTISGEIADGG